MNTRVEEMSPAAQPLGAFLGLRFGPSGRSQSPARLQAPATEQMAQSTWGSDLAVQEPRERHRH